MPQFQTAQCAHDIRNALGSIALRLETLERTCGASQVLAAAHRSLATATALCRSLEDAARTETPTAHRRSFDVMMSIVKACELVAPVVPEPTVLDVDVDGPFHVLADPHDVFRILFNLLHNAAATARRTTDMRHIALSVAQTHNAVVIRIRDDGPGLPEAMRARPFRLHQASTNGGSGCGLAIARELAERNGGTIELANVPRGTAFTVELPRADAQIGSQDHIRTSQQFHSRAATADGGGRHAPL